MVFQHKHHRHAARAALPEAKAEAAPVQTLVSIVYVTASPTFTGAIGGYTTIGVEATSTTSEKTTKATTTESETAAVATSILAASSSAGDTTTSVKSSSTSVPTAILAPSTTVASSIALLAASSTTTMSSSKTSATGSSTASSTAAADSSASGGMSTGGKVGLAFGIICLIGVALSLALFFFKKRKDAAKHERLDDEKNDIFSASSGANRAPSTRAARTASSAPRLSLGPVTQFVTNFNNEKQQGRGNAVAMANSPQNTNQKRNLLPANAWNGPQRGQESNKDNPFGNHAEAIDVTNANGPPVVQGMSARGDIVAAGSAGAMVVPTAASLARGASKRGNGPKPLDLTKPDAMRCPPSPAGTEFSMSSEVSTPTQPQQSQTGTAIAAAGGPANSAVYRIQLDFKPSMDDELELTAGQLIRVLHEYDDGWALCIRLDRSQQGVVPRTCLSTRPVKPRPQQNGPRGPPPGMRGPQQQRPMSPAMNQGPPYPGAPAGNRPMTPKGNQSPPRAVMPTGPMAPNSRPMTPTGGPQQRPMTPNGGRQQQPMTPTQGRARSPSVAQVQAPRNSPPGPSPMNPQSDVPATAPDFNPNTPQLQDRPQGPPPAAMGAVQSVQRKPVGQAL